MKTPKTTEKTLRDAVLDVLDKDIRSIDTHLIDLQSVSSLIVTKTGTPTNIYIKNIDDLSMINHEATIILGDDIETSEEDFIAMVESGEITITVDPDVLKLDGMKITPLKTAESTTIDIEWTTYNLSAQYVIETGPSSISLKSSLKYCPIYEWESLSIFDNYGQEISSLVASGEITIEASPDILEIDGISILQKETTLYQEIEIKANFKKWNLVSPALILCSIPNGEKIIIKNYEKISSIYTKSKNEATLAIDNHEEIDSDIIMEWINDGDIELIDNVQDILKWIIEDNIIYIKAGDIISTNAEISIKWISSEESSLYYFDISEAPFNGIYEIITDSEDTTLSDLYLVGFSSVINYACYGKSYTYSSDSTAPFLFYQSSDQDVNYLIQINKDSDSVFNGIETKTLEEAQYILDNEGQEALENDYRPILLGSTNYFKENLTAPTTSGTTLIINNTESSGDDTPETMVGMFVLQYTYDGTTWKNMSPIFAQTTTSTSRRRQFGYGYQTVSADEYSVSDKTFTNGKFWIGACAFFSGYLASSTTTSQNTKAKERFLENGDAGQVLGVRIVYLRYYDLSDLTAKDASTMNDSYRTTNHLAIEYRYLWSKYNQNGEISDENSFSCEGEAAYMYANYKWRESDMESAQKYPFLYFDKDDIPKEGSE